MKAVNRFFARLILPALLGVLLLVTACTAVPPVATQPVFPSAEVPVSGPGGLSVKAVDQEFNGTSVVVPEVVSQGPGWIAIHIQENGGLGPVIAFAHVSDGVNKDVVVEVDPAKVTPVMYAMLHVDAGVVDTYEFPGPDVPAKQTGVDLSPPFSIEGGSAQGGDTASSGDHPSIKIVDQDVQDGKVIVEEAVSDVNAWLDIHIQNPDGKPGRHIGFTAIKPGVTKNVEVTIDPNAVTSTLFAMIHEDAGEPGTYESPNGPDKAIKINDGQTTALPFTVKSVNGVPVPTSEVAANPEHTMETPTGTAGDAADAATPTAEAVADVPTATAEPTATEAAVVVEASPTPGDAGGTDSGVTPSITVADQPILEGTVTFPKVVSVGPAWLVIHRQNGDGTMGSMVGVAPLVDGVNENVSVRLDTARTSTIMYAMLHADKGTVGVLEFPGADEPVFANGEMINPTFAVTSGSPNDITIKLGGSANTVPHLVTGSGRSLYIFLNDTVGKSNCTGTCQVEWKPLLATGRIVAGEGLPQEKLGVILLPDGTRQMTFAGQPLYTYINDTNNGDAKGQGFDGLWFVVTP